ncbi:hypothetical protein HF888_07965 [Bermanella marisrubri]|uniref:TPR-repeat-containing protein n=1 Tax=Bermanella marisrubri TaxID=207949 RepID=Q1N4L2_9GAMM|nr:hypothetical protein [Bermanella marisrubri]EAT13416.1 TPR-repeat-containing protein [Oceanobacter sp. RED65] [Bermanella marisrubri]QIZ84166.1 hypothetical protein HF888_07965 [Bermanella marisrubri]
MRLILACLLLLPLIAQANLSPRVYNQLEEFQEDLNEAKTDAEVAEVRQELLAFKESLKGNALGVALSLQTLSQVAVRNDDLKEATEFINEALRLNGLPDGTRNQLLSFLANLYYQQDAYTQTISTLQRLFSEVEKEPGASNLALMAAAYFSLEDFEKGTPYIDKANKVAKEPKQPWLQMGFAGHYQLKQLDKALAYATQLVFLYPDNARYWQQKAGLHQMMEDYSDAASVKYLSFLQGLVDKESDFLVLARLMASQGGPYHAAKMLDKALEEKQLESTEDVLRLTYQGYLQAKEMDDALSALQRLYESYPEEKDGVQVLRLLVDGQAWQPTVDFYSRFKKQEMDAEVAAEAAMLAGIAEFNLDNIDKARALLGQASKSEKKRGQAKAWLNYIQQMQ